MLDGLFVWVETFYMKAILIAMAVLVAPVMAEDEDGDVGNFAGAVLNKSAIVTGRRTAVTSDGKFIYFNGRGYATSDGYYGINGNQTFGAGKLVIMSKSLFYGTSTTWKNGNSYTDNTSKSSWVTRSPKDND